MRPILKILFKFVPDVPKFFVTFSILSIFLIGGLARADETHDILDKARVKLASKKNQAHVLLKIIEPGGEIKVKEMNLQTLQTQDGFEALVRMTAPLDNKGTALLAVIDKGEQRQWIYLPSNKQVRRVASVNKSSGLLGSELSPEDLNPEALKGSSLKLLKKDATSALVQLTPAPGTSEYTSAQTTFSLPDCLPQKSEFYKGPVLQKTVEFQNYKSFENNIYRAQKIHIKNIIKNRGTDIELTNVKVNANLSEKDFTPEALKENW